MTPRSLVAAPAVAAALSLVASPAVAAAFDEVEEPPASQVQGTPAQQAKAYGRYCQNQSKKHVPGEKGTPFSQCVTAMAKLARGVTDSPREACKALSKKHVRGEKGTPFSRCVAAGAKLLREQESV